MVQKGNMYLYTPEPPEKLLNLLHRQQEDLARKEDQVHRIIGELKGMMNPFAVLPKIRFFEGRDGVLTGYRMVLESIPENGTILSYLNALEKVEDEFHLVDELKDVTADLARKQVTNLIICPQSEEALRWQKDDDPPRRVTRLMAAAEDLNPVEIMIFNDSLFGVTVEGNQIFAYVVENRTITQMHRLSFQALWATLA